MKRGTILSLAFLLTASSLTAAYAKNEGIVVVSSPQKQTVTSAGNHVFFTKFFDVSLANAEDSAIDLSKGCFKAYYNGKSYDVDTVQDSLSNGTVKPNESAKGFVGFSGQSDDVYKANVVKYLPKCK